MRPRLDSVMMCRAAAMLVTVSALSCSAQRSEVKAPSTRAGTAVVYNAIDFRPTASTYFVVQEIDGVSVHAKYDRDESVAVNPGERRLGIRYYGQNLFRAPAGAAQCEITFRAEAGGTYRIEGMARAGQWRARLLHDSGVVESPCLFADSAQWGKVLGGGSGEVAVHAARPPDGGDGSESAAASAVPVAVAGDAADAEVRVVAAPDEGAAGTPVENTRVGADKPLAQGGILSLGSVRRALTNSTESDWGCAGGTFRVGQVDASGTVILLGSERVRLIGVRIEDGGPPNGEEGFALTSVEGACVKLRFDDANRVAGHRDHQGRLLAYVFLSDGTFVNLELIRAGLAKPLVTARYEYLGDFMAAQSEARSAGRGIWERSR